MRIGLASDDLKEVRGLRRLVEAVSGYRVIWVARTGREAVAKAVEERPDLVLLKLTLPEVDGVQATRLIVQANGCPILLLTPTVPGHSEKVFEAMGHGALDAVSAPRLGADGEMSGGEELLRKIGIIRRLIGDRPGESPPPRRVRGSSSDVRLVAIGASTGGPRALATILSRLPARFPGAVVVVQHVDLQFVGGLVDWLKAQASVSVELAREGSQPMPGQVLVAGTQDHLVLGSDHRFHYVIEPRDYPYRPSVDSLFESLKRHWPHPDIAVLLTGMGKDGAKALLSLRQVGWHTIVQDEATSTVYGMPKAAAECGAAVEILPVGEIADSIIEHVNRERK